MNLKWTAAFVFMLAAGCCQAPRTDANQVVEVVVDGKAVNLDAGPGYFWDEPVYNDSQSVAYLLKNHGSRSRGYSPHSVVKVTPDGVVDPVVPNATIPGGDILSIYKVSGDGMRLLVELHFVTRKDSQATYFDTRPVTYDVEKGEITEIEL